MKFNFKDSRPSLAPHTTINVLLAADVQAIESNLYSFIAQHHPKKNKVVNLSALLMTDETPKSK